MLSLIVTYYNQPSMLAEQSRIWATYSESPDIIVVDDGSSVLPEKIDGTRGYRIDQDIPWHQDGARNLGAHVANGEWLLFLDIDHAIGAEQLDWLLSRLSTLPERTAFRPNRRLVDGAYFLSPAANIWLIRKSDFWKVGGYDERLCGHYGTDLEFRPRLNRFLREVTLPVTLDVYRRCNIADATTAGLDRKVVRPPKLKGNRKVLGFEWKQSW